MLYTVEIELAVWEMADCLTIANKVVLQTNESYHTQMVNDFHRNHAQSPIIHWCH